MYVCIYIYIYICNIISTNIHYFVDVDSTRCSRGAVGAAASEKWHTGPGHSPGTDIIIIIIIYNILLLFIITHIVIIVVYTYIYIYIYIYTQKWHTGPGHSPGTVAAPRSADYQKCNTCLKLLV